jgi:methylmalonyl-CoA/ethylmalonyl-CoA epimerase
MTNFNKIEHIGIAVSNLEEAIEKYTRLLGIAPYKTESVESEGVITVFFQVGESKIELLAATNETSVIAKFIAKNGEGIHHIAFGVDDIHSQRDRVAKNGLTNINLEPKKGADNKWISFIHPKDTCGTLVELCSDNK